MVKQYKKIMNDEMTGYHKQMDKMKRKDNNVILKTRKRGLTF